MSRAKKKKKKKKPTPIRVNLSGCKYQVCEYNFLVQLQPSSIPGHVRMGTAMQMTAMRTSSAVRIVQRKLGWKEVGDDEDWEVYWTDTSVSIERIIKLNRIQVRRLERGAWC